MHLLSERKGCVRSVRGASRKRRGILEDAWNLTNPRLELRAVDGTAWPDTWNLGEGRGYGMVGEEM